jgi:hypothetical protein
MPAPRQQPPGPLTQRLVPAAGALNNGGPFKRAALLQGLDERGLFLHAAGSTPPCDGLARAAHGFRRDFR